jgi:hypothetical protein
MSAPEITKARSLAGLMQERDRRLPAATPSVALAFALAILLALALGRLPLNLYDVSFSLDWGRELIHGELPDVHAPGASTPHPLSILAGAVAALFSADALDAMRAIVFVAAGAAIVSLLAVGRACGSLALGVVAVVLLAVSQRFVSTTLGQATVSDLPALAAVLAALALELSRPRRGTGPLVALAIAGLLRPEAWLLSAAYWLYLARSVGSRERIRLAALALSAPLLWMLSDTALSGDPLYSLLYTREATVAASRPTGLMHVPRALDETLGGDFPTASLIAATLGVCLDLWLRRLPRLLIAMLALTLLAFAAVGAAKMPIDDRYALPSTVLVAVYFGYFMAGWRLQPDGWLRRSWILAAAVLGVLTLVSIPSSLHALARSRRALSAQAHVETQLGSLLSSSSLRGAIAGCGPVQASYRIVPILAYDLGRRPSTIVTVNTGVPPAGVFVEPSRGLAATEFESHSHPLKSLTRRGYRVASEDGDWLLYMHCLGPHGGA